MITTHLYPHTKSLLTSLIQKHAAIEVCEVEEDTEILPDKIYVMPENKVMTIDGERLVLKSGYADFVLHPKKMPEQVIKIVKKFDSR